MRTLLIHGARAVVQRAANKTDAHGRWMWDLKRRKGTNCRRGDRRQQKCAGDLGLVGP